MSLPALQLISFKNTALFKRGIWLSVAAVLLAVVAPSIVGGAILRDPLPSAFSVSLLLAFAAFLVWRARFYRLVDEVLDARDRLEIRRGPTQSSVAFADIALADVATSLGIHRIILHLREPSVLGRQIEFLPQASLWSNLPGIRSVASNLTDRANRAKHSMTA